MSTHPIARRNVTKPQVIPQRVAVAPPMDLARLADQMGIDVCDVACDAMPALVLKDLDPADRQWVVRHTKECSSCRDMLARYEFVNTALDRLAETLEAERPTPPPLTFLAKRLRRAAYARIESPVGPLFVAASDQGVCEVGFGVNETEEAFRRHLERRGFAPTANGVAIEWIARQLQEYFRGERNRFEVPLDFSGVPAFTRAVLLATAEVPYGHLATYRDIAQRVGRPGATRAVGNALGRNPIPIIVPCHRIVRSDSSLGGYAGGIEIKQRLLAHEGATLH